MRLDFKFTGKAGVKEFWKWCFSVLGISLAMAVIMAVMIAVWGNRIPASPVYEMVSQVLAILFGNFLLVVLFLSLAVAYRRLQDAGISPWWLLMPVILCLTSAFVFMDAGLENMSAMPPSVPVVWQVVTYSVTALVGFIFMCLFCKSSKK